MANGSETIIAIGKTDGFRYVAIKPPLVREEINHLLINGGVRRTQLEQITLAPACTLVQLGELESLGRDKDELATQKAQEIADSIRKTRGKVTIDPKIVDIYGGQSSPFNPLP